MEPPDPPKVSKVSRWFKGVTGNLKGGFKKLSHSSPTSRSSTPDPRISRTNHRSEGPSSSNEVAEPTSEGTLQSASHSGDSKLPENSRLVGSLPNIPTEVREEERKPSSPWYTGIKVTLALVEKSSDVFPPLKSAVAAVNGILGVYDAFGDNQQEFSTLAERVKLVHTILSWGLLDPELHADGLGKNNRTLEGLTTALAEKLDRSVLKRVAQSTEDQQEIVRLVREVSFAIEIAMFDVTIRNETLILQAIKGINWLKDRHGEEYRNIKEPIARIERGVAALYQAETLKNLGSVTNFAFSNGTRRRECVPGSRVGLLSEMLAWGIDRNTSHAFWLSGMAGTGKTAVTETFCSQLSKRRLLGASFFCSLTSQELSDARLVIPTLAKALARARPEFGTALTAIIDEELSQDHDPLLMKIPDQYERLILEPAKEAFQDLNENVILAVDALDECKDHDALLEFIEVVLSMKPPAPLKIFLTSRPESLIRASIESTPSPSRPQSCRLHDIERDIVRADIELFVNSELGRIIRPLQGAYQGNWPPPEIQTIVDQSGTLFIVAATIVRYIGDKAGNRIRRFQAFGSSNAPTLSGIQQLYHDILKAAFGPLDENEQKDVLACLSLLVTATRPLSVPEYAGMLGCSAGVIQEAFRSLHSVVQVPSYEDGAGVVSIYHASFIDFLTEHQFMTPSPTLSGLPWSVDRSEAHSMVAKHCFRVMNSHLRFNIANISSSFIFDSDNLHLQSEIERNILPELRYSCLSWSHHLSLSLPLPPFFTALPDFLQLRVLFWIETMNLLGSSTQCDPDLLRASEWAGKHEDGAAVFQELRDAGAFALYFSTSPASRSTPHLYFSSLATWPGRVPTWRKHFPGIPNFRNRGFQRSVSLMNFSVGSRVWAVAVSPDGKHIISGSEDGLIRHWDAQTGTQAKVLNGHSGAVHSVAFSRDGQYIASGSEDHLVCVWNVTTEEQEKVFRGHTGQVWSVAFSNDSKRIVSSDTTVRVWDAITGEEQIVLQNHMGAIYSVVFSPDGALIVSGSEDRLVRLWNSTTGEQLKVLKGHKDRVKSLAFSSDSTRIVSGSDDKSLRLWDATTGEEERAIEGHTDWVRSVAFSSDNTRIVSGSGDRTARLWDVTTGKELKVLQGHMSPVESVTFSIDGRRVISGSADTSVRVWDIAAGVEEDQALQGHAGTVFSAAFSKDSTWIASGSGDMSVRIWDGTTGELLKILEGHAGWVNSVAFSNDGTRIVSGSEDMSVLVWDAVIGQGQLELLGHTGAVYSATFSSDGTRIVSASMDATVRIWDAVTGEMQMVLEGHTWRVYSATFSSDGARVASASGDRTVRIWDTAEGKQLKVLKGHTENVCSVAFSPDGTCIASGSADKSVRIWEALTGKVRKVLKGHTKCVWSVVFSNDGTQVATGSWDNTVRVWDLETGKEQLVLRGHPHQVLSVAFSRDGTRIVSGSADRTVRVWDLDGLSYISELIENKATGWLLSSDGQQNRLVYAPVALIPQSPCALVISGTPGISSYLSPLTFPSNAVGDNWQNCFTPSP